MKQALYGTAIGSAVAGLAILLIVIQFLTQVGFVMDSQMALTLLLRNAFVFALIFAVVPVGVAFAYQRLQEQHA